MKHQEQTYADKYETVYCELAATIKTADWLNDEEREIAKHFFVTIASPRFNSRVKYTRRPTGIIVEQSNENLVAYISHTIDDEDLHTGNSQPLSPDGLTKEMEEDLQHNVSKQIASDIPEPLKKKGIIAHYRVFEQSMYDKKIPLTCDQKDVRYISNHIERIEQNLLLNRGMEGTLAMRKMLMKENLKDSLTRHYEGQGEMIERLAEDFHTLNWQYYTTGYEDYFHSLHIEMKFESCTLKVVRIMDKPIDIPILASLFECESRSRYHWLRIPPTEIDEGYLVSHLSEFINGELPDIPHIRFQYWDKERDTPKSLKQ